MPTPIFKPVNAEGQISAGELRRIGRYVANHELVQPPLGLNHEPYAKQVQVQEGTRSFPGANLQAWIKIVGYDAPSKKYVWRLVQPKIPADGTFEDHPADLTGGVNFWPAYETTGKTDVATDGTVVVRAWPGDGENYLFTAPGAGGGTASAVFGFARDGSATVPRFTVKPITWNTGVAPFWALANPTRLTVPGSQPNAGKYFVTGTCLVRNTDIGADFLSDFFKNGVYPEPNSTLLHRSGACSGNAIKLEFSDYLTLNPGDFLEYCVYHNQTLPDKLVIGYNFGVQYLGA